MDNRGETLIALPGLIALPASVVGAVLLAKPADAHDAGFTCDPASNQACLHEIGGVFENHKCGSLSDCATCCGATGYICSNYGREAVGYRDDVCGGDES